MRRLAIVSCALLLSACFRFDERLAACRSDAGAWVCGDAGVDAGGGGFTLSFAGLQCFSDGGWCWEHPRPAGSLRSVAALAANDVYVGTAHGLVLHLDDAGWRSTFLGQYRAVTALCGRPGEATVFAGSNLQTSGSESRLFALSAGVTEIAGARDEVTGIDCSFDRVWVAHTGGLWSLAWGSTSLTDDFVADANDFVVGVTATGPSTALILTGTTSGDPRVSVRDQTGALQTTFTADASPADIWTNTMGAVQVALNDGSRGSVWEPDAGGWTTVYAGSALPLLMNKGTPWRGGALAVGSGGLIVELEGNTVNERLVQPIGGSSDYSGVAGLRSGEAWAVGASGCMVAREASGSWRELSNCDPFLDFSLGTEAVAVSSDALYRRAAGGWEKLREGMSGVYGVWTNPDGGGIALLSDDRLIYKDSELAVAFTEARDFEVLDEDRVVVLLADGTALDTNLKTGGDAGATMFGPQTQLVVDRLTRTFWARTEPRDAVDPTPIELWSSSSPGQWSRVDAGGPPLDVAVGFGRVWVVSGDTVFNRRSDGSWGRLQAPNTSFSRAIVIDETRAWVATFGGPAYVIDSTTNGRTEVDHLPINAARHVVWNNEVWVLGGEGLLRRPVPPRP